MRCAGAVLYVLYGYVNNQVRPADCTDDLVCVHIKVRLLNSCQILNLKSDQ